jgi:hypothetical protein
MLIAPTTEQTFLPAIKPRWRGICPDNATQEGFASHKRIKLRICPPKAGLAMDLLPQAPSTADLHRKRGPS